MESLVEKDTETQHMAQLQVSLTKAHQTLRDPSGGLACETRTCTQAYFNPQDEIRVYRIPLLPFDGLAVISDGCVFDMLRGNCLRVLGGVMIALRAAG